MGLAHALRPDGIEWPKREDGATSFRLEHLAAANHVRIGDAHEALSDVRALIGMARLLKQTQPRLWEHAARLRNKRHVRSEEHTSELQSLMRTSYAVFCLKNKTINAATLIRRTAYTHHPPK